MNNNSVSYVYKDNIPDDYVLPIWNYNGISFVTNKGIESKQYLDKDIYDNKYSYLMGKYYFIFDLDSEVETSQDLFIVNVEDYGKNSIILPDSVSGKMYINGSFKKKLYFTDLKSKKQYTVDPVSEKVVVVGDEDTGYSIFDGDKLGTISSNEFLDSKYYFDSTIVDEIQKKYPKAEVKKDGNYYAFKTTDNIIYLVSKDDLSVVKKLFHFNHISEWNIKNGDIMVLNDDTMYLYTEGSGLKPVLKNKEFTFNHYNICNFYKKS